VYFPLVFFLNAPRVSRWNIAYLALFGLLLVPVDYYYVLREVSISVIVYTAVLSALLLLAMVDHYRGAAERSWPKRIQLASANAGGHPESRG
jgi:hypothetical protein